MKAASHLRAVTRSRSLTNDFSNFAVPHGPHGSTLWVSLGQVGSATNIGNLSVSGWGRWFTRFDRFLPFIYTWYLDMTAFTMGWPIASPDSPMAASLGGWHITPTLRSLGSSSGPSSLSASLTLSVSALHIVFGGVTIASRPRFSGTHPSARIALRAFVCLHAGVLSGRAHLQD